MKIVQNLQETSKTFTTSISRKIQLDQIAPAIPVKEKISQPKNLPNNTKNLIASIEVTEENMVDIINKYKSDTNVAFAHCISRDFVDKRSMSAGVAVTFKKKFGRPSYADCLSDHLTLQKSEDQAAVYGLITKPTYCSKPTHQTYDAAFYHLEHDFRKRNYRTLFCSPLGCTRDQISPQHFVTNIVNFHRRTGVPVNVVVSEERASRALRNGLKHEDFVNILRSSIAEQQSQFAVPVQQPAKQCQPLCASTATSTQSSDLSASISSMVNFPPLCSTKPTFDNLITSDCTSDGDSVVHGQSHIDEVPSFLVITTPQRVQS